MTHRRFTEEAHRRAGRNVGRQELSGPAQPEVRRGLMHVVIPGDQRSVDLGAAAEAAFALAIARGSHEQNRSTSRGDGVVPSSLSVAGPDAGVSAAALAHIAAATRETFPGDPDFAYFVPNSVRRRYPELVHRLQDAARAVDPEAFIRERPGIAGPARGATFSGHAAGGDAVPRLLRGFDAVMEAVGLAHEEVDLGGPVMARQFLGKKAVEARLHPAAQRYVKVLKVREALRPAMQEGAAGFTVGKQRTVPVRNVRGEAPNTLAS